MSKERLLDELRKIFKLDTLEKLSKNKLSLEIFLIIFPELKNINIFSKLSSIKKELLSESDFIFLLSLVIIDKIDNADYFLFKFNISKKEQKRIKNIDNFYKEKITSKTFTEINMNKVLYYHGRQAVLDILKYKTIMSKKFDSNLIDLIRIYENKIIPTMPVSAGLLMQKYKIPEGKQLGTKIKKIEEEWVNNNFQISDKQIDSIVNN